MKPVPMNLLFPLSIFHSFSTMQFMRFLKRLIKSVPPFRKVFADRDALRVENARLFHENAALQTQSQKATGELKFWKHIATKYKTHYAPGHFYSPIPSLEELRDREDLVFQRNGTPLPAIEINTNGQLNLLRNLAGYYKDLSLNEGPSGQARFYLNNPNFTYSDAIFFFCLIRYLKPRRILEIGSGFSSCVALDANDLYFDGSIECTFIDPFPQLLQSLLKPRDLDRITIIQDYLQEVPLSTLAALEPGDILFIDSSHVAKTGSDLNDILFHVLPVLESGVYVHFHDIFYPFEYPREWVFEGRAWNESYLLRAFLSHNEDFVIELFSNYLVTEHKQIVAEQMPLCLRNEGGSLWLRKRGGRTLPLSSIGVADQHRLTPPERRRTPESTTRVDVVNLVHPRQLGAGWYQYDNELARRFMGDYAEVRLGGPSRPGQRLWLEAYQPNPAGVTITVSANHHDLGARHIERCAEFKESFSLPEALVGASEICVTIRLDKTTTVADDSRKLGLGFGTIFIQ